MNARITSEQADIRELADRLAARLDIAERVVVSERDEPLLRAHGLELVQALRQRGLRVRLERTAGRLVLIVRPARCWTEAPIYGPPSALSYSPTAGAMRA